MAGTAQAAGRTGASNVRGAAGATVRRLLPKSYLLLVLLLIVVIGYCVSPYFITARNASNVINFSSIVVLLAVGQFYVILTGGIDLSIGSILAFATVVAAILMRAGMGAIPASGLTLAACGLVGAANGVLVVGMRIPPFIATLAMMSMIEGLSYIIQSSSLIEIDNDAFLTMFADGRVLGVSDPVLIFVAVTAIAGFCSRYTVFGRRLYAIGGNREAARLSGLPVGRDLLVTYTLSGLLAGLAGLVAAAELTQGSSLIGRGDELNAIAAVVVGGASLFGGKGDPLSAVIGVFVLATIVNIMNLVGISSEPQLVIKGAVIITAVFLSSAGGVERISSLFRRTGSRSAASDVVAMPAGRA